MNTQTESVSSQSGQSGGYAVDNVTYDLIAMISAKSEGLDAMKKYMQDAQGNQQVLQVMQQVQQADQQCVQQLVDCLKQVMK